MSSGEHRCDDQALVTALALPAWTATLRDDRPVVTAVNGAAADLLEVPAAGVADVELTRRFRNWRTSGARLMTACLQRRIPAAGMLVLRRGSQQLRLPVQVSPLVDPGTALFQVTGEAQAARGDGEAVLDGLEFEALLSHISSEFINLSPDRIDPALNRALRDIGRFLTVDRILLALFSDDGHAFDAAYDWTDEGCQLPLGGLSHLPPGQPDWFFAAIREGRSLFLPGDAPGDSGLRQVRDLLDMPVLRAVAAVPLMVAGRAIGFMGVLLTREQRRWSAFQGQRLMLIGEVFANAIARKASREALVERDVQLQMTLEAARVGTWQWDIESGAVTWSPNVESLFGMAPGTFAGTYAAYLDAVHPDDREAVIARVERVRTSADDTYAIEHRIVLPDRRIRWIEGRGRLLRAIDGTPRALTGTVVDITKAKTAERAQKEALKLLQAIMNNTPAAIFVKDPRGRYININRTFVELFGRDRRELLGRTDADLFPGAEAVRYTEEDRAVLVTQRVVESEMIVPGEGGDRVLWATRFPLMEADGRPYAVCGIATDITERKETERQLLESEARFRTVVEDQTEFIVRWRPDGTRTFVNDRYCRYFGLDPDAAIGTSFLELIDEGDRQVFRRRLDELTPESPAVTYEHQVHRPDGRLAWNRWTDRAIFDGNGVVVEYQSVGADVTARRAAEAARIESERNLSLIFNGATEIMLLYTCEGEDRFRVSMANEAALAHIDMREDTLIGQPIEAVVPEPALSLHRLKVREAIQRHEKITFTVAEVHRGSRILLETTYVPFYSDSDDCTLLLCVARDITEAKRTEEALRLSEEKFSTIFRIAPTAFAINRVSDQVFLDVNEAYLATTGLTRDELLGKPWGELGLLRDGGLRDRLLGQFETEHQVTNVEVEVDARDGQGRTTLVSLRPIVVDGETCVLTIANDITDRKRAEEAVFHQQRLIRSVVNDVDIGLLLQGPEGTILHYNGTALDLLDLEADQLLGRSPYHPDWGVIHEDGSPFPPETRPIPVATVTGRPVRKVILGVFRPRCRDRVWLMVSAVPQLNADGAVEHVVCSFSDITEQKRAEENLRRNTQLLRESGRVGRIGGWELDVDHNRLVWTEEVFRLHDLPVGQQPQLEAALDYFLPAHRPLIQDAIQDAVQEGHPFDLELELITARGRRLWVRTIGKADVYRGAVRRIFGVLQDISAPRRAAEQLRLRERQLSEAQRIGKVGHWRLDLQSGAFECSEELQMIFGFPPGEAVTQDQLRSCVFEADLAAYGQLAEEAVKRNSGYEFEHRIRRHDNGEVRNLVGRALPEYDSEGRPVALFGINQDITDRKRIEEALRASEELFSKAFRASPDALAISRARDARLVDVNEGFEQVTGHKRAAALGKTSDELDMWKEAGIPERMREIMRRDGRVRNLETAIRTAHGQVRECQVSAELVDINGELHQVSIVRDVTEQKIAENRLRASEDKFSKAFRASPDAIAIASLETGRIVDINGEFERITGYAAEAAIGRTPLELRLGAEGDDAHRHFEQLPLGITPEEVTASFNTRTGETRIGLFSAERIEVEDHPLVVVFVKDITEQRRAEADRHQMGRFLQNMTDAMPSVLIGVDQNGLVTHWNHEASEVTGLTSTDAMGRPLAEVFPIPRDQVAAIDDVARGGAPLRREKIRVPRGAAYRYLDMVVYPLDDGRGAVVRIDDVSDRVRMEEIMIQTEKMMSVGGLAAGMAHEINNPLAVILQSIQVIRSRLEPGSERNQAAAAEAGVTLEAVLHFLEARRIHYFMEQMQGAGERAATIVENMLSFSRKSSSTLDARDIHDLIERTVELAHNDWDLKKRYDFRNVRIERAFDTTLPRVPCDGNEIQQVLFNLLKNAAQAMAAVTRENYEPVIVLRTAFDGDRARIEVEDNGPGIPESVRKRIFEPFFTTKEVGVGTGLGLSVSFFIVTENHGGELSVESLPGQGARFIMRLPLEAAPVTGGDTPRAGENGTA